MREDPARKARRQSPRHDGGAHGAARHLILGDIYHQPAYVCDTHCIRITGRLGLTDGSKDPLSVEKQLRQVLPPEESSDFCHRMVLFGRDICTARKANCEACPLKKDCDYGKAQK